MTKPLILAIDQGTSSTKALLVDQNLLPLQSSSAAISISSPKPGWVQQDALEIHASVEQVINELCSFVTADPELEVIGVALTNQRESAIAWYRESGLPIGPMLGWQDRRTENRLADFDEQQKTLIRAITGLALDPMFSALKFAWLLDQNSEDRELARRGEILLGTVDSYIQFRLTGEHVIEVGNASRTQLLDIKTGSWSAELCEIFDVPLAALPEVVFSDRESAEIGSGPLAGKKIRATLADSHAALYAHRLHQPADVVAKATFGTGSSIMAAGKFEFDAERVNQAGMVSTVAWATKGEGLVLGVEGNIISSGSTMVWLNEFLGRDVSELAELAMDTADSPSGLNLVPAFSGLGAPWWQSGVSGQITGLTLSAGAAEIARAGFEAIVLQIEDVIAALEQAIGVSLDVVRVDGGPTSNRWLMQLHADLSQRQISRTDIAELSAVGVAALAWQRSWQTSPTLDSTIFNPKLEPKVASDRRSSWTAAVSQVISSAKQ